MSNLEQVRARVGQVIAIATEGDEEIGAKANDVIFIPESGRSQFVRFTDDFILRPVQTFNQVFATFVNFRLFQLLR